jgi:hypothetical protein
MFYANTFIRKASILSLKKQIISIIIIICNRLLYNCNPEVDLKCPKICLLKFIVNYNYERV